jgi:hypothetical protein
VAVVQKEGVPKRATKAAKAPKTGPKDVVKTAKPTKTAKGAKAPAKTTKVATASTGRSPGRPKGSVKRDVKGLEVFKTFNFDRPDSKEPIGGLRRVVIEAGPDASKQLEKLVKMVERNDKKLRDILS